MTSARSTTRALLVAVAALVALSELAAAQEPPRTEWGNANLQGVWDFRTITPLERPEDLGDKAFLTVAEAAEREQAAVDRDIRLWERAAQLTEAGGNVGGYNNFWMDNGNPRHRDAAHLAHHRTRRTDACRS